MPSSRGSDTSGSRSTRSGEGANARSLHRVAFSGGSLAHWALFLPDEDGSAEGTLVHVGVETGSSGVKRNHRVRVKKIRVTRSSARSVHVISGARITRTTLEQVAKDIFNRKGYNVATNNCQHFCFDVIAELHLLYPDLVPQSAVDDMRRNGTTITNVTNFLRG
ncbi:hypothetical protein VTI28DRAFT_641 [Corynascus sepedonium]